MTDNTAYQHTHLALFMSCQSSVSWEASQPFLSPGFTGAKRMMQLLLRKEREVCPLNF